MQARSTVSIALFLLMGTVLFAQEMISITPIGSRTRSQLVASYGALIQNGVEFYRATYTTPDVFGQLDTASGLIVVPVREQTTIFPLLVYQHGTVDGPLDVPSRLMGGYQIAEVFGGMGYVTLAPDYLGAGTARGFHPYVHADSEASAAVDMVRAMRSHAGEMDVLLNNQLFITGYSQGGHASMALHRAVEQDLGAEMTVTAASHLSGPYSISGAMRELILSDEPYFSVAYLPNTFLSYNYVYQLYESTEQVFKPQYVPDIERFYNGEIGLFDLNLRLIAQLTAEFGGPIARNMLQDSIVDIVADADADHPLMNALRDNDVYEWAPQVPTRIMYCTADDQVSYRNSIVADSVMQLLGAPNLLTIDVDPNADHGQCVNPTLIQTIFFFANFADWTVGTVEVNPLADISLYPNPVVQNALFVSGLDQATDYCIFDSAGRLITHKVLLPGGLVDCSSLAVGQYWIWLSNERGQVVKAFGKQ